MRIFIVLAVLTLMSACSEAEAPDAYFGVDGGPPDTGDAGPDAGAVDAGPDAN